MRKSFLLVSVILIAAAAALTIIIPASAGSGDKSGGKTAGRTDAVQAPAASTTLTLSQVYGGGGGTTGTYSADYVEIKNISSTPQSLNTLQLMYGSATGQFGSSAGNIQALPNVTLNPGQYYLVQLGTVGAGGIPVPSPDLTNASTNLSGSSGKMALVTAAFTGNTCGATATPCTLPNANIIDLVSYGVSNNAEGGAPSNGGVALTSTQGNVRKTNGCTDTDNNNADNDIITAPVPRNSTTTAAPCAAVPVKAVADYNGDGKTDFTVIRNGGGNNLVWYSYNGTVAEPGGTTYAQFGLTTDLPIIADFDGDNKTDIAIWRGAAAGSAGFWILQSSTGTVRFDNFGQTGDDASMTADYDGDGKADPAVYRAGAAAGQQSFFYYRQSGPGTFQNQIVYVPWGLNGDFPVPGDYDGDGKTDFCITRDDAGQARFWIRSATGAISSFVFALNTDFFIVGDFDGDGKADPSIARQQVTPSARNWFYKPSSAPAEPFRFLGSFGLATDTRAAGDYDGDGKMDIGVWRSNASADQNYFFVQQSTGGFRQQEWGQAGDNPITSFLAH